MDRGNRRGQREIKMCAKISLFIFIILLAASASSKSVQLSDSDIISIPQDQLHKLGSGYLQLEISKKMKQQQQLPIHAATALSDSIDLVIYTEAALDQKKRRQLNDLGCRVHGETWTRPVAGHQHGFVLARASVRNVLEIMQLNFINKIDVAERTLKPQTNVAAQVIQADACWDRGYDGGAGGIHIKIAVLDAGLDETNPDLPSVYEKKDYSDYPTLDDDVTTFATGHGTHVTGIALGRGVMSASNIGNGGAPYKGMAPGADLVFLKIGKDSDGTAKGTAIYNALDAAVQIYNADVINLSYGGWDTYHDGSYYLDQKVDEIVYNYDVPVIIAAGNYGASKRHYSDTVAAHSKSDFIQVDVVNASANSDLLKFNTVWYDGLDVHNEITLEYYDSNFNLLTDVRYFSQAESPRGTEHQVSYYNPYLPAGDHTFYLRIVNNSDNEQVVHIYEDDGNYYVSFRNADERYTISSPATADNAFAVGACGDRESWNDYTGGQHSSYTSETLCSFSGRGPRVDGASKPQITAPGKDIIAIRDRNVYTSPSTSWVDNDGVDQGDPNDAHYVVRTGTSMAAPVVAGSAALILNEHPDYTADQVYSALTRYADAYKGVVPPDESWGYGVLDLDENDGGFTPIDASLIRFSAKAVGDSVFLTWSVASEINHAGYNILKSKENEDRYEQINNHIITSKENTSLHYKSYSFTDYAKEADHFSYMLEQISLDGTSTLYGPEWPARKTSVDRGEKSFEFRLPKNYPNPFNSSTTLTFAVEKQSYVEIGVYDLLGRKVRTLIRKHLNAGVYNTIWKGRNEFGEAMSSGTYIIQMRIGEQAVRHKVTLLR